MDPVGDLEAAVIRHARERRRQCERNALKGVVVVVQDDDVPWRTEAGSRAAVDAFLRRGSHDQIVVACPPVSTVALDVEAVRARFSALRQPLVFFDAPGGTQVPDSVIDAVARYYRESNANVSGPYGTSRRTEALIAQARLAAGDFLRCTPDEVIFGANMTTLAFALSRAAARGWREGDEIVVTKLDHDANVSPWLELAHDLRLVVHVVDIHDDTTLDLDDFERKLSERTRVVAFPVASNAVGTIADVRRITDLAHSVGALAWADAVHYGPHGPIDTAGWDVDVLICSPYKFFGPHLGVGFGRAELLARWRPYKVRPAPERPPGQRFETGTLPHELLAGFVAAVEYVESIGWDAIQAHERTLGERFLAGLPASVSLYGLPTMDGRVATFAFNLEGMRPDVVAGRLGDAGFAVWHGNYYAVEVMRRLGLEDTGAVRVGIVHYNTADEVDGLLAAIAAL
jgi:cysteine desulfurase family protein (TIGR01976 family)